VDYTVRNVRLAAPVHAPNRIAIYAFEARAERPQAPGPVLRAVVPVHFDPPDAREPPDAVIHIDDAEFVGSGSALSTLVYGAPRSSEGPGGAR